MRINSVTLHLLVCHLISSSIHENIFGKNVTSKCEAGGDKTFCEIYTRLEASRVPGFYLRCSMEGWSGEGSLETGLTYSIPYSFLCLVSSRYTSFIHLG